MNTLKSHIAIVIGIVISPLYYAHGTYPEPDFYFTTEPQRPQPALNVRITPEYRHRTDFYQQSSRRHPAFFILDDPAQCASWQVRDFFDVQRVLFGYQLPVYHNEVLPPEMKQFCTDGQYVYYIHDDDRATILRQWKLYDFDNFWQFIQSYPDYESCIHQLYAIVANNHPIKQRLSTRAIDRIQREYNNVVSAQAKRQQVQQEALQKQLTHTIYAQQASCLTIADTDWQEYSDILTYYECGNTAHLEKRSNALQDIKKRGMIYSQAHYNVDKIVSKLLQSNNCDVTHYTNVYGNQLQHAVHQECIDLLIETGSSPALSFTDISTHAMVNFVDAAREYNSTGMVNKACTVADFCWAALEYGKAIARDVATQTAHAAHKVALYSAVYGQALLEGGTAGLVMAVDDMLEHPIQTALTVAAGEYMFAYQLSKLTYNLLDLGITALVNTELAQKKWNAYVAPLNHLIAAINDKETTFRDAVKTGATLAVCWHAQSKILQGCGVIYRSARDKAIEFIKNNHLNPEQYMETAEGIILNASNNNNQNFSSSHESQGINTNKSPLQETGTYKKVRGSQEHCRVTGPQNEEKAWEWAEKEYEKIREMSEDIEKIAQNTNKSPSQIARIKKHLFFDDTHKLDTRIGRLDADPEIARAWDRLRAGDFIKNDIRLLEHEYFESKFERIYKTTLRKAHEAAQSIKSREWKAPVYEE